MLNGIFLPVQTISYSNFQLRSLSESLIAPNLGLIGVILESRGLCDGISFVFVPWYRSLTFVAEPCLIEHIL